MPKLLNERYKRNHIVAVRFNDKEIRKLETLAKKLDLSDLSKVIRELLRRAVD